MQVSDFKRFAALMNGMAKMYERELDEPLLDAYWMALRDWPFEEFERAAAHLMQTSEFMPRAAAFTALRKVGRPTVGEAWARAVQHCESGAWRSGGTCGDAGIDNAVGMIGGYRAIALCEQSKLGFIERRFAEHYETAEDAKDARAALPSIARDDRPLLT